MKFIEAIMREEYNDFEIRDLGKNYDREVVKACGTAPESIRNLIEAAYYKKSSSAIRELGKILMSGAKGLDDEMINLLYNIVRRG